MTEDNEEKWFIPEDSRKMLLERFGELDHKVILEVFVDEGSENPYNILTMLFVNDLARLGDKIEARVNTIGDEKSPFGAKKYLTDIKIQIPLTR